MIFILGDQPALWFVPIFTSLGDGLTYPRQCQINEEDGFSDGYDSDEAARRHNRRFQNGPLRSDITIEDTLSDEDDEEELLLPKSSKNWHESGSGPGSAHADTSPDSIMEGPAVTYEGFNNKLTKPTEKS